MRATDTEPTAALALWSLVHDSAFPTGRLVHSHGLEQWLSARPDADPAAIEAAVVAYLAHGYAPLDATITAAAWRAFPSTERLSGLDDLTSSYKLYDNARTASESTGRQLARTAWQIGLVDGNPYFASVRACTTAGHAAVVEGALQAHIGVGVHLAVLGSLRSMFASMLSVAVRLGRLGPMQSQRIQVRHVATVVDLMQDACCRSLDDLSGTAPAIEISGMRHETHTARLFAT
jgi:urease accessory protein